MKYGLCNLGNFGVIFHQKNVMDSLIIMELKIFGVKYLENMKYVMDSIILYCV